MHRIRGDTDTFAEHIVGEPAVTRRFNMKILSRCSSVSVEVGRQFYFEQIRVLKAGREIPLVYLVHGIIEYDLGSILLVFRTPR